MINKFFDYKALSESDPEEDVGGHGRYISKYVATHFEKIANLNEDLVRVPSPGEFFFLQSDSSFNAFTFVMLIAKSFPIKEMYASTYSLNREVVDALMELHDRGAIEQLTLLVNDGMISRNPVTMDNLKGMASSRPNVQVFLAWVHAKVCIIRTHHAHFVVEGSGNWSKNAQYEQYTFANDEGLYNFRKELFTTTKMKKY